MRRERRTAKHRNTAPRIAHGETDERINEVYREGIATARTQRSRIAVALLLIYAAWGILAWLCFACARSLTPDLAPSAFPLLLHHSPVSSRAQR